MARSKYSYEKRQKELAKKKKKEAKRLKKLNRALGNDEEKPEVINENVNNTDNEAETTEDSH